MPTGKFTMQDHDLRVEVPSRHLKGVESTLELHEQIISSK